MLADLKNKAVKIVSLSDPHTVSSSVKMDEAPRRMARLSGGLVAVNTDSKLLHLLDVEAGHASCASPIKTLSTSRQYVGVVESPDDDTLLVGCWEDNDGPARVDIIGPDGVVVRTVVDGNSLPGLEKPCQMSVVGGDVLVPDLGQDCVYRVQLSAGRLLETLTHPDLKKPTQVVSDEGRNLYVVSFEGQCVLGQSPRGEWRRLLHGPEHGAKENILPWAMCLINEAGVAVSWMTDYASAFVVIG